MRNNREITEKERLLDKDGNIAHPGYSKKLNWIYDRNDIKAPKWRIKEWDYYYVGNRENGLCLTISDAGFCSSLSVSLLGFGDKPFQYNCGALGALPLGKLDLPWTSEAGDIHAKVGDADMTFLNNGKTRHLFGTFSNYCKSGKELRFDVTLSDFPEESMVIATPFDKKAHFYYNQKINCMKAEGFCSFDGNTYVFNADNGSLGSLDWGRGVWTYDNTWYWGSGQMLLESGDRFGFNIGYGFGDTSAATENVIFYDGKVHKLDDVTFHIPEDSYMKPWRFSSDHGRFEMDFVPILDRAAKIDFKVLISDQHQVFGRLSGKAVLDDGRVLEVRDVLCFAEKVHNRY